jgi:pimeloyl-ACP methyl ester carboxylesterase
MIGAATPRRAVHRLGALVALVAAMPLLSDCLAIGVAGADRAGVHRSEYVRVQDAKLYVLVRGADGAAPVLLWLHGGPGGAERPLLRYFNSALEKRFVVAYWDQRGAGRSFDPAADPNRLTVAQHLADLDRIVDHLRASLSTDKIILVGHSWGAALGLLYAAAHPGKVLALVAVNPLVSRPAAEQSEYHFVINEAARRNDQRTLTEARRIGSPPFATSRTAVAFERLVQRYGGIYHNEPHRIRVMIRAVLRGRVTPLEIRSIIQGNDVSLAAMHDELRRLDLRSAVPALKVPIALFLGRYDRHVDATISASYFDRLHAPVKRLVWFEHSAHNVPFEEPKVFNTTLIEVLGSLVGPAR